MRSAASRIALQVFFIAFCTILASSAVSAHAVLVSSSPKDNAILTTPPREVVLRFDARIEKGVSQVTLLTGAGRKVDLHLKRNWEKAGSSDRLIIPLPPLKPETYRLQYRVLATDGHLTPGFIRFTISKRKTP